MTLPASNCWKSTLVHDINCRPSVHSHLKLTLLYFNTSYGSAFLFVLHRSNRLDSAKRLCTTAIWGLFLTKGLDCFFVYYLSDSSVFSKMILVANVESLVLLVSHFLLSNHTSSSYWISILMSYFTTSTYESAQEVIWYSGTYIQS